MLFSWLGLNKKYTKTNNKIVRRAKPMSPKLLPVRVKIKRDKNTPVGTHSLTPVSLNLLKCNEKDGIIFAIISAIVVQLWFGDFTLSLIISISMILNMIVAGLFGILVPVSLQKLKIDPALASSVFVTTITDVIGFLSFLGIGAYFFL